MDMGSVRKQRQFWVGLSIAFIIFFIFVVIAIIKKDEGNLLFNLILGMLGLILFFMPNFITHKLEMDNFFKEDVSYIGLFDRAGIVRGFHAFFSPKFYFKQSKIKDGWKLIALAIFLFLLGIILWGIVL